MQSCQAFPQLDKPGANERDMQPSGDCLTQVQPLFRPVTFRLHIPIRKTFVTLYDRSTFILTGTEFVDVAYAELNDPRQLTPLAEVLSKLPPSNLSRFVDWRNCSLIYGGVECHCPYKDLYLRSWTVAVGLLNKLLRYEVSFCLEELQRQLQQLSRAFHVAIDGILGCPFKWQVDLLPSSVRTSQDDVPACNEAFKGINSFPVIHPTQSLYTAAGAYGLMAILVLEVRFQQAERHLREAMNSEERDAGFYSALLEAIPNIWAAPSSALVFDGRNPFRLHVSGFDLFIAERYQQWESTSHLSIMSVLASCKVSTALQLYDEKIPDLVDPLALILADTLCHQETLNFLYDVGKIQQPPPIVKSHRRQSAFVSSLQSNYQAEENEDEGKLAAGNVMVEIRAAVLRKLGHEVDWSRIQIEQLPESRFESRTMVLDGVDTESRRVNSESWPLTRTIASFCCLRS